MASVPITELKAHLSKYLRMARRGVEVQVLERGVPVARLLGMPQVDSREPAVIEHLVSAGILRRGGGGVRAIAKRRLSASAGLLQAVLEEREEGT